MNSVIAEKTAAEIRNITRRLTEEYVFLCTSCRKTFAMARRPTQHLRQQNSGNRMRESRRYVDTSMAWVVAIQTQKVICWVAWVVRGCNLYGCWDRVVVVQKIEHLGDVILLLLQHLLDELP